MIVIELLDNEWRVYTGPVVHEARRRLIVTLELTDMNGSGKLDAIVYTHCDDGTTTLLNTAVDDKGSS